MRGAKSVIMLVLSVFLSSVVNNDCLCGERADEGTVLNESISVQNINVLTAIELLRVISFDNAKYENNNNISAQVEWLIAKLEKDPPKFPESLRKYISVLKMIKDFSSETAGRADIDSLNSGMRHALFEARDAELSEKGALPVKRFWKLSLGKQSSQGSRPNCAATSIHMLLSYYGIKVESPVKLAKIINYPGSGATVKSILDYMAERKINFRYYVGCMTDLREQISGGNPVLVLQAAGLNYREQPYNSGHVRIAVGYDDNKETVNVIDPNYGNRKFEISYSDFELLWLPGGFYCIVLER
ncbi:MAG: C39 family peptidase [bacterium]|nr:C39 family peptidase [bacterium]